jgi:putative ABC transport system permease protein
MFNNYMKTAIRNLLRHRFFSAINVFGLAVAMALSMMIIMLVADQMMNDRYNSKRDRICRINSIPTSENGATREETSTTSLPIASELLEKYTGIEKAVRIVRGFGNPWMELAQNNVNIPLAGYYADPEILEVFEYELEYGDKRTALAEPFAVILSKKSAKKLFRQENPVGEIFKVGDLGQFKVTGVLKETTKKTHIAFDALASIATVKSLEAVGKRPKSLDNWYNYNEGWVYLLLQPGRKAQDIVQHLEKIQKEHYSKLANPDTQQRIKYHLQNLLDITPGSYVNNSIGPFLPWAFVYFFIGLASVVMLTSCFNFTNLSIARSLTRAREVGVRKVTGALRRQVFIQFISESVIVAMFALAVALVLLIVLKPLMMELSFARVMKWNLESNYLVYSIFVAFALVVGVLAGLFPAIVMSAFQPVKVLKGVANIRLFSRMGLRRGLLVAQFTFSLIFILTVIVVFNQLQMLLRADYGFNMDKKVVINLGSTSPETLKTELLKYVNVENVAAASHLVAANSSFLTSYKRSLDEKDWTDVYYFSVDEDYLKNIEVAIVAGRFFLKDAGESNKKFIVISEKAAEKFHFKNPIDALGQEVIAQKDSSKLQIIGVMKNYNHQILMEKMEALALVYNPKEFSILQVKYTGNYEAASKSVEAAWSKINPDLKVDYKDFNTEVRKIYDIFFGDLVSVLGAISILAIMISCLGLLGMATYATETRVKEISIRKVLGSSDRELMYLLSKGFISIILVAIFIAVPAAYFINNLWLKNLAYHVSVDALSISLGVALLLIFSGLTIGSQTWRALLVSPVENLKGD